MSIDLRMVTKEHASFSELKYSHSCRSFFIDRLCLHEAIVSISIRFFILAACPVTTLWRKLERITTKSSWSNDHSIKIMIRKQCHQIRCNFVMSCASESDFLPQIISLPLSKIQRRLSLLSVIFVACCYPIVDFRVNGEVLLWTVFRSLSIFQSEPQFGHVSNHSFT